MALTFLTDVVSCRVIKQRVFLLGWLARLEKWQMLKDLWKTRKKGWRLSLRALRLIKELGPQKTMAIQGVAMVSMTMLYAYWELSVHREDNYLV